MSLKTIIAILVSLTIVFFVAIQVVRETRAKNGAKDVTSTSSNVASPINVVASAGFWFATRGGELKIQQEDALVIVDDRGNVFHDDRSGKSGKIFPMNGPEFQRELPDNFLIIENMDRDEWVNLVKLSPSDRHVQVVRALCQKHIPIAVFMEKGMIDAEQTAYGDPCSVFLRPFQITNSAGAINHIPDETRTTTPDGGDASSTEDLIPNPRAMTKVCRPLENFNVQAKLVANSPTFTIEPYECRAGIFLVVSSMLGPACSISLDNTIISSVEKYKDDDGRERVRIAGTFASKPLMFNVSAHYSSVDVQAENSQLPSDSVKRCI